jgi:hypothetical protein
MVADVSTCFDDEVPRRAQCAREMAADKAACAGDQDIHAACDYEVASAKCQQRELRRPVVSNRGAHVAV